jgi:hypothetical protein
MHLRGEEILKLFSIETKTDTKQEQTDYPP